MQFNAGGRGMFSVPVYISLLRSFDRFPKYRGYKHFVPPGLKGLTREIHQLIDARTRRCHQHLNFFR